MKFVRRIIGAGALLVLVGCATHANNMQTVKMSGLFCRDADWVLSGLRDQRVAFNSTKAVCAADRLKLAAQILVSSDNKSELSHARSLVDSVLNGTEVQRDAGLLGLATLLDRQLSERRRADDRADKQGVQIRDQQARIDDLNSKIADLNSKITALTALEQSMALKSVRKRSAGQ